MASSLYILHFRPVISPNSLVIPGAQLAFYEAGGNTLATVYADADLTTPLPNPVVANAAGVFPNIYMDNGVTYGVELFDADGVSLSQTDPYFPGTTVELSPTSLAALSQANADAVQVGLDAAQVSEDKTLTQTFRNEAQTFRNEAEAARDAAVVNGNIYADTTAGLAATSNTEYFAIPSASAEGYLDLYRNNAGTADLIDTLPNSTALDNAIIEAQAIATAASDEFRKRIVTRPGPSKTLFTVGGEVVAKISSSGLETSADFIVARPETPLNISTALASTMVVIEYGQSNSTGVDATPALTTTQPYSNVMFVGGAVPGGGTAASSNSADYSSLVPAVCDDGVEVAAVTAGNFQRFLGAFRYGEDPSDRVWITSSAGKGGAPISGLSNGTDQYENVLVYQFQRAATLAPGSKLAAIAYTQGEADQTTLVAKDTYKTALSTLQADAQTDAQAQFSQTEAVPFLIVQILKDTTVRTDIPQAQFELCRDSDNFYFACPMYALDPQNSGLHLTNVGQRLKGAYIGRALDDLSRGVEPQFLRPTGAIVRGSQVRVKFSVPYLPLRLDTASILKIQNYGFRVTDDSSTVTINSVFVDGDTVVINLATVPTGTVRVRYAFDYTDSALTISNQNGGAGNLRDSAPETITISGSVYNLHNWAPHFEIEAQIVQE